MKTRNGSLVGGVARLLLSSLVLFTCATVFTETAQAQRPAPTPISIDRIWDGKEERVELEGGKFKLIYRNKAGQIVQEEEFVLGVRVSAKYIYDLYPSGQEAKVELRFFRDSTVRVESIKYDRFGNPQERIWVADILSRTGSGRWQREKWNQRTQKWEPAPERQRWNPATGSSEEAPENERFNAYEGRWEKIPPAPTTTPSDASDNRTTPRPDSALTTVDSMDGITRSTSASPGYQVANTVAGGLSVATFTTPQGTIYVNLPSDMAAGDTLSGTVVAEAQGQDDKKRTKNQGELAGYVVEIEKQQTSSTNRILRLSIPAAISTTYLVLRDKKGKEVARCELPLDQPPRTSPSTAQEFGLPTMGQQGRSIEVTGDFDGDFKTTNLMVGGEGMEILAESPRKLVVRNSSLKVGPSQLVVREQGRTATGEFRSLGISLSAPKLDLLRGEQTTLTVTVLGLEGIRAPVPLVLENKSPGIISMGSANIERISISPSQVQAGTYTTERALTGIQRGAFTIVGTVATDGN